MTCCPACHKEWLDLPRHLAFAHQEQQLLYLDLPPVPAPQPGRVWWYGLAGLALLILGGAT